MYQERPWLQSCSSFEFYLRCISRSSHLFSTLTSLGGIIHNSRQSVVFWLGLPDYPSWHVILTINDDVARNSLTISTTLENELECSFLKVSTLLWPQPPPSLHLFWVLRHSNTDLKCRQFLFRILYISTDHYWHAKNLKLEEVLSGSFSTSVSLQFQHYWQEEEQIFLYSSSPLFSSISM